MTEPWTIDGDLITPTFKVMRNRVEEIYGPQFEAWCAQGSKIVFTE